MSKYLFIFFFICLFTSVYSQDIIVLKSDESEIKCRIISITDTTLSYTLWQSSDTKEYTLNRSGILSYLTDPALHNNGSQSANTESDSENQNTTQGLLGRYKSSETSEGYIIKENGDTINGFLKIENVAMNQLEVSFFEKAGETPKLYTTDDLKGYGYNGLQYHRIKSGFKGEVTNNRRPKDGIMFLHCEVDGPARLYRLYILEFQKNQLANGEKPLYYMGRLKMHYVITNPSGKSICTKGRTIKGTVNRIFEDNASLKEEVYSKGVNEKNLPEIVEKYNLWYTNQKKQ